MNKMNKAAVHAMVAISAAKKQKGASSLEYIMLAAIIVAILIAVGGTEVAGQVVDAFKDVFGSAAGVTVEGE